MAFLALDIGSGLTKYCTLKGECGDIISAVGQVTDPAGFTLGVPDHLQIQCEGKAFLIGIGAINNIEEHKRTVTTKALWCEDRAQLKLFYSVVAKLYPDGLTDSVQLVVGLPVSKFAKHHETHKKMFVGLHKFKTPNASYEINVADSDCAVLPQVVGLHFTNLSISSDKSVLEGHVGYIDPGTHSCGIACVSDGVYNALRSADDKSKGSDAGLHKLAMAIKDELRTTFGYEGEVSEILKGLRQGFIPLHGEKQSKIVLKDVTDRHVHKVYAGVVDEMAEKWKGGKTMRVVISSGVTI